MASRSGYGKAVKLVNVPSVQLQNDYAKVPDHLNLGKSNMHEPVTKSNPAPTRASVSAVWLGLLLAVVTIVAYLPALRGGFIWDDDAYVTKNTMLTAPDGLSKIWFSTHRQSQYFPLTYTTLRFERALWGLNPQGYHAVNVLLHVINALLLWQLLRRLVVPGAWLAAALFALHPAQVESVAWITELKNVQSTMFYLLALLAWVKFVGKPTAPRWNFYLLALLFHAFALFSKTTACTLPAALLLVLWWCRETIGWRRVLQVLPFLLMGLSMGLVSVWWEKHLGSYSLRETGVHFSFVEKALIATRAVWFYAAKVFWPVNLTFSYPRWEINPYAPVQYLGLAGCGVFALLLWWRRHIFGRGLAAGVVFFVAALSPVLGFIPLYTFRYSFVADHYQYLACAGLIAPFAALLSSQMIRERLGRALCYCLPGGLLLALGFLTWQQSNIYANKETLWQDTLAKNPASWMAHHNLGLGLFEKGQIDEAISHYRESIRLNPDHAEAHNNLGTALFTKGQIDEGISQLQEAIRLKPDYVDAHYNLGSIVLYKKGQIDEAIIQFQEVIRLKPDDAEARNNLGTARYKKGQIDEAIIQFQDALRLKPDYANARNNLRNALGRKGQIDEAIIQFQEAIRLKPGLVQSHDSLGLALARQGRLHEAIDQFREALELDPNLANVHSDLGSLLLQKGRVNEALTHYEAALELQPGNAYFLNNLAWVLATCPNTEVRNGARAVELAQKAERLSGGNSSAIVGTLAAAYAEVGRFGEAVRTAERALDLATAQTNTAQADMLRANIALFRAGSPFHEAGPTNGSRDLNHP